MGFTWVRMPVHLIGELSPSALILLSLLLNGDLGSHTVCVRQTELAAQLHCSVRNIDTLLRELEREGLVTARERMRTGTRITLQPDILPPRKKDTKPEKKPARTVSHREAWERTNSRISDEMIEKIMNPYGVM